MASDIAGAVISAGGASVKERTGVGAGIGRGGEYLAYDARRREVLQEFTLTGKLSVAAGFLLDESEETGGVEQDSVPLAKARQRLEQLEAAARGGASVDLSQAEYERRISKLQRDLTRAWNGNMRVTSLKIAIQCSKLLGEPRVPAFYPSMFVLVTDILDTFGRLVFERLKGVAEEELARMRGSGGGGGGREGATLPADFASGDVGAEARETCRNWIYKTACIRELLPRLYVEMALLECYRFLHVTADFAPIILRLSHSIRGIGNPLVAVYARWYLARQAAALVHDPVRLRSALLSTVTDYLYTFHEIASPTAPRVAALEASGVPLPLYLRLHSPAVAWLMALVGHGAPEEVFKALLASYRECCGNAMVLRHIIDGFDGAYWSENLPGMLQLVKEAKAGDVPVPLLRAEAGWGAGAGGGSPREPPAAAALSPSFAATVTASGFAELYRAMAGALVRAPPPAPQRLPFLNEAWKAITRVGDPVVFSRHAAALLELLVAAYTEREVLLLLGDLVKRLTAAAEAAGGVGAGGGRVLAPVAALPHLQRLLTSLVDAEVARLKRSDGGIFGAVVSSEFFGKLLDMFHSDAKPALCKQLLNAMVTVPGKIGDAVVINSLLEMARAVHDELDALSPPSEHASTSALLCTFIEKIDFGRDMERTLDFLSSSRQAFPNLDEPKAAISERSLALADTALGLVKGRHTAKTAAFVRSVFGAAAVTIPAIEDPLTRLRLWVNAGSAALRSVALAQADAFFRSAVEELPELPAGRALAAATSPALASPLPPALAAAQMDLAVAAQVGALCAALVPMPGHPEKGPFYLASGLLVALGRYPWSPSPGASPARPRALIALLPMLHAQAENPIPGRIPGVESNDSLYAADATYPTQLAAVHRAAAEAALKAALEAAAAGQRGLAIEVLLELAEPALVARCLQVDAEGSKAVMSKAVATLRELAPQHPAISLALAELAGK